MCTYSRTWTSSTSIVSEDNLSDTRVFMLSDCIICFDSDLDVHPQDVPRIGGMCRASLLHYRFLHNIERVDQVDAEPFRVSKHDLSLHLSGE